MYLGQEFHILGNWFVIHFTENNGMAFGLELAGDYGKLFLSVFRIVAVGFIGYYLYKLIQENSPTAVIASISLVFAGAMGNIIDSVFYGKIFNDSLNQIASLFPEEGGYSKLLHGRVVDMLYFPLIEGHFPQWFPLWASEEFLFFRPVFNIADSAITVGVGILIVSQYKTVAADEKKTKEENVVSNSENSTESTTLNEIVVNVKESPYN